MADRRFKRIIISILTINVLLSVVASFINSSEWKHSIFKSSRSVINVTDEATNTSQPYIVPKLPPGISPITEGEGKGNKTFKRVEWSDSFLPNDGVIFPEWISLIPKNYASKPEFVLGVPTIARKGAEYLYDTLTSLIMNIGDKHSVVIVVYIGEANTSTVQRISFEIHSRFAEQIKRGLIQVINPPKDFYPNWDEQLRQSFNDPFERIKWRSKQNLDQIFLMMYAYHLQPDYYIMLEDDIIASNDFISRISQNVEQQKDKNYVLISYCQLGAIGKLFRRKLLPSISNFLSLFWADKPLDWLLLDYMRTRICNYSEEEKKCAEHVKELQIIYKPSLFQHIGTKSSFPGKKQLLKDKAFKP